MFYYYTVKFDTIENLENFAKFLTKTKQPLGREG